MCIRDRRTLTEANLVLGCTPIINLFEKAAKPMLIRAAAACRSYPVVLDAVPPGDCEIYSIDSVQLVRKQQQGTSIQDFSPYYSLRQGSSNGKGHYWLEHRDDLGGGTDHGVSLTLVDQELSPLRMEDGTASVQVTCTNRNIPYNLQYGRAGGDLRTVAALSLIHISEPTRPY